MTHSVYEEVLPLPVELRTDLLQKLLLSLNLPTREEIGAQWRKTADRRANELLQGKVEPVPGTEVFEKLRARFEP